MFEFGNFEVFYGTLNIDLDNVVPSIDPPEMKNYSEDDRSFFVRTKGQTSLYKSPHWVLFSNDKLHHKPGDIRTSKVEAVDNTYFTTGERDSRGFLILSDEKSRPKMKMGNKFILIDHDIAAFENGCFGSGWLVEKISNKEKFFLPTHWSWQSVGSLSNPSDELRLQRLEMKMEKLKKKMSKS